MLAGTLASAAPNRVAAGAVDQSVRTLVPDGNSNAFGNRMVVLFSPDGNTLLTGGLNRAVHLWDPRTGVLKRTLPANSEVRFDAFTPDSRAVAYDIGGSASLWDSATGKRELELEAFLGPGCDVLSVGFSPDGKMLRSGTKDGMVLTSDVESGKMVQQWRLPRSDEPFRQMSEQSVVAVSPDGETVATEYSSVPDHSANNQGAKSVSWTTMRLWDAASGKLRQTFARENHWHPRITFSPNGRTVASHIFSVVVSCGPKKSETIVTGEVALWQVATGRLRRVLPNAAHAAFSPDGKVLATGSTDHTVKLWDVGTGKLIRVLTGHKGFVRSTAFSPDGQMLATASDDGTVKLWDIAFVR